jgi:hypothetical protein
MNKIISAFPQEGAALKSLVARGDKVAGSCYLPADTRCDLMQRVKESAQREGVTFSSCREGWATLPGINCDGSHLLSAISSLEHNSGYQ